MEVWKDIPEYEGFYQVSNLGNVKNSKRGKLKRISIDRYGYQYLQLHKKGFRKFFKVHRLVASVFIPNPNNKLQVNHKDGNKLNNQVSNLEWATHSENIKHGYKNGLFIIRRGDKAPNHKLTKKDVEYIRKKCKPNDKKFSVKYFATKFNVSMSTISSVIHERFYKKGV